MSYRAMGVAAVGAYGNRSIDGLWSIRWTAEAKFPMLPTLRSPTGPLVTTDPGDSGCEPRKLCMAYLSAQRETFASCSESPRADLAVNRGER